MDATKCQRVFQTGTRVLAGDVGNEPAAHILQFAGIPDIVTLHDILEEDAVKQGGQIPGGFCSPYYNLWKSRMTAVSISSRLTDAQRVFF
jgi:hypothetical protein